MLKFTLQAISYLSALVVPYFMLTSPMGPAFHFPFFAVPILILLTVSGPLSAAGVAIYATVVGTSGFIFTMGDLTHGTPVVFLLQMVWLWGLFWMGGRLIETKDMKVHHLQEEQEKLEVRRTDLRQKQRELDEFCDGLRERQRRYKLLREFTDDLAATLQLSEIRRHVEAGLRGFFGRDPKDVAARLELFPAPGSPLPGDAIGKWAADHRTPLLIPDAAKDARCPPGAAGTWIVCPVEREGLAVGTLSLEAERVWAWKEDDVRFFADIGHVVSVAVTNASYYEKIEQLAVRDSLTGLFARYRFDERVDEEFARAKAGGAPLSLLVMDIDHFKQVNDRFGHPAGDQVLKVVAQLVSSQIRETDFCARYGGEEIAVLMPLTQSDNAAQIAERIRRKLESAPVGPSQIKVTLSGGIASLKPDMAGPQDLVRAADQNLYRAKHLGRNRIISIT